MNKKNQKGFMLVELIITSTIVVAAMVTLYTNFNKVYSLYKTKNNYYNVDGVYATKEMTKNLLNNDFNKFINEPSPDNTTQEYKYIIKKNQCNLKSQDINNLTLEEVKKLEICLQIQELYGVKNMIFTEYSKEKISSIKDDNNLNETFKEYIEYVINYYDITDSEKEFSYIILTEIGGNGSYYYSNLRIR